MDSQCPHQSKDQVKQNKKKEQVVRRNQLPTNKKVPAEKNTDGIECPVDREKANIGANVKAKERNNEATGETEDDSKNGGEFQLFKSAAKRQKKKKNKEEKESREYELSRVPSYQKYIKNNERQNQHTKQAYGGEASISKNGVISKFSSVRIIFKSISMLSALCHLTNLMSLNWRLLDWESWKLLSPHGTVSHESLERREGRETNFIGYAGIAICKRFLELGRMALQCIRGQCIRQDIRRSGKVRGGQDLLRLNLRKLMKYKQLGESALIGVVYWKDIVVYGSNSVAGRNVMWEDLYNVHKSIQKPWLIVRDFNAVFCNEDKLGGRAVQTEILIKHPRIMTTIDRVNEDWISLHPDSSTKFLDAGISDHSAIIIKFHQRERALANDAKKRLTKIQNTIQDDPSDLALYNAEARATNHYIQMARNKESFLKQKSRVAWLQLAHSELTKEITDEEIHEALFDIDDNKAPGLMVLMPISLKLFGKCQKTNLVHLAFANDLLVFSKGEAFSAQAIKDSLNTFKAITGLGVNNAKSAVSGVELAVKQSIYNTFEFEEAHTPF
ncbi:hypothetical protein GIB67_023228 [Kingdonia uniflora]|uniref:Uncharacterized protein n=1 Tax=Kingdonia uniflora TaxID=39325 RepID=A0A7J7L957_9MAGN|nr:hypothetical protein GIB67_023228 [Kingdonia uniflora]